MRVLITFALENEFAPWRGMRAFQRDRRGGADAYFANIGDATVGVVLTGVGSTHACRRASDVLQGSDPIDYCISSGLAGGLRPGLAVSDVVVARTVSSGRFCEHVGSNVLPCDASLVSVASEFGASVVNRIHTSDRAVCTAEEKRVLGEHADVVEMESFQIVKAAWAFGARPIVIRAISDVVCEDLPLSTNRFFSEAGKVSIPRVMGQMALHPQLLPGLVRLGMQSKRATATLAKFLDSYVERLTSGALSEITKVETVTT
jgi:nucleoside phosphorylase